MWAIMADRHRRGLDRVKSATTIDVRPLMTQSRAGHGKVCVTAQFSDPKTCAGERRALKK